MPATSAFNVDAFLDKQKIGSTHIKIMILLVLTMILDGYDILVVGSVLPPIAQSMHVKPHALTGVFVAQQAGLLTGTLMVGPLADRFGRRTILLTCITAFTLLTLATTQVHTPSQFAVIRFLSAVFFSAVIPNCMAMASEIAPNRVRAGILATVFCGYACGHFVTVFVQAFLLEQYGWQSAFWTGGILGVGLLALLSVLLPESIRFRTHRNGNDPRIGAALQRFDRSLSFDGSETFVLQEAEKKQRAPIVALFSPELIAPTLLIWLAYIGVFTVSHLTGAWSTTVLHNLGGLSFKYLASMGAISTTVGIVGTISSGFLLDRFGPQRAMPCFFIGGALVTACYGFINLHTPAFYLVGACSSFFANAGLGSMNVLAALIYPSRIRATGISWATGAGRLGGMLGPIMGGAMLAQNWDLRTIYLVTGSPLFLAALAIALIGRWAPNRHKDGAPGAVTDPLVATSTPNAIRS